MMREKVSVAGVAIECNNFCHIWHVDFYQFAAIAYRLLMNVRFGQN
jgi:hypothetical protein